MGIVGFALRFRHTFYVPFTVRVRWERAIGGASRSRAAGPPVRPGRVSYARRHITVLQRRSTLAAELVVDRTTLGRNIRPLEPDDLIAIESDPSDRRSRRGKILRLTKAGYARFERARKRWAEARWHFERAYGKQASQLRERLRAIVASDLGPFDTTAVQ
jgi:DNA-binding MarR family transcriptional regulator